MIFDDDPKWRLHVSGGKIEDFRNPMLARLSKQSLQIFARIFACAFSFRTEIIVAPTERVRPMVWR
jgi:hypothetical protein